MIRLGQLRGRGNCRFCFHQLFKHVRLDLKLEETRSFKILDLVSLKGKREVRSDHSATLDFIPHPHLEKRLKPFQSGLGITL